MNLNGAYYLAGDWIPAIGKRWDDILAAADRAKSRSVRFHLAGGVERLIKLGSEWVAI